MKKSEETSYEFVVNYCIKNDINPANFVSKLSGYNNLLYNVAYKYLGFENFFIKFGKDFDTYITTKDNVGVGFYRNLSNIINWGELEINNKVFRVTSKNYNIKDAIQDSEITSLFSIPSGLKIPNNLPSWPLPSNGNPVLTYSHKVVNLLNQDITEEAFDLFTERVWQFSMSDYAFIHPYLDKMESLFITDRKLYFLNKESFVYIPIKEL